MEASNLLMSFVIRLVGETKVEWCVPGFISEPHEVLSLAGPLVSRPVFVSPVLCTTPLRL